MTFLAKMMQIAADDDFTLARDLIAMALADGKITEEERTVLGKFCNEDEITEEKLRELLIANADIQISMPATRKEREEFLVKMILLMGADGESSPEEIILLELLANKMGFSRMELTSIVLMNSTHHNFPSDFGTRVLSTFMKNIVDPIAMSDRQNHDNIARIYDDVAKSTRSSDDPDEDREILKDAFESTTQALLENQMLISDFQRAGLDFTQLLHFEAARALERWTRTEIV